jgi:hypothetical protein
MLKNIMEVNGIVAKVLFSEQFVDQNSRNAEVNDFINDVKNDLYEIQKIAQHLGNMNQQPEEVMKLIQKIGGRVNVALEKMKVSSPEDVNEDEDINEDKDLIGASVFGIGGEEKLVDIVKGKEKNTFNIVNSKEVDIIRNLRKGDASAPLYFQIGGWYYPAKVFKKEMGSTVAVIDISDDKVDKKSALGSMQSYVNRKKPVDVVKPIQK